MTPRWFLRWRRINPVRLTGLPLEEQAQILAASRTPLEQIADDYLRARVRFIRHL